jgi:hypothetical protein
MAQIMDWLAQSYRSVSKPLNASRALNCFAELQEQDAKSKAPVAVWGWPGTSPFATIADTACLAANIMNGILYVVGPANLWQINLDGAVVDLGPQGCAGRISIDNNGAQMVWVDGTSAFAYQVGGLAQPLVADANPGDTQVVLAVTGTITNGDTLNIQMADGSTFTTAAAATVPPGTAQVVPLASSLPSAANIGNFAQDPALTLAQITDPNFFPSYTVTFFDGYFAFVRFGTKEYFLSPLFGISPFDASLFASKEATSDLLLAIANTHEQLILFGQERAETWYDAGNAPPTFPFQRSDGALIQRGLAAVFSIVLEDNTIFWLGEDGMYYRLEGFQPLAVSNRAVEYQWSTYPTLADCFAFSLTLWGHKMIVLTFPSGRATWVLDLSTKRWHERESWLGTNADTSLGYWRPNFAIKFNDRWLLGDSQSGQIQQLNENVYTEFGDILPLTVVGPPFHTDRRRVFMKRFEVDMETGVGLTEGPATNAVQYCAQGVSLPAPGEMATTGGLLTLPTSFSTWLFSGSVSLPDNAAEHGVWFSNQTDDTAPGQGGLQIGIFNDTSSPAAMQLVVRCYDSGNAIIVQGEYAFTSWTNWVWVGISCDTATKTLQVYVNDGTGDQPLNPSSLVWSSSNAVAPGTSAWHILPSGES